MSRRTIGIILVVIGLLVMAVSLFAASLGLGAACGIFGWKQQLGTGLGFIVFLLGLVLSLRRNRNKAS